LKRKGKKEKIGVAESFVQIGFKKELIKVKKFNKKNRKPEGKSTGNTGNSTIKRKRTMKLTPQKASCEVK
jgi:hypothetical protein